MPDLGIVIPSLLEYKLCRRGAGRRRLLLRRVVRTRLAIVVIDDFCVYNYFLLLISLARVTVVFVPVFPSGHLRGAGSVHVEGLSIEFPGHVVIRTRLMPSFECFPPLSVSHSAGEGIEPEPEYECVNTDNWCDQEVLEWSGN